MTPTRSGSHPRGGPEAESILRLWIKVRLSRHAAALAFKLALRAAGEARQAQAIEQTGSELGLRGLGQVVNVARFPFNLPVRAHAPHATVRQGMPACPRGSTDATLASPKD